MEWNIIKAASSSSSWDLGGLDQAAIIDEGSSSSSKGGFCVDLKLGHNGVSKVLATSSSSPSGSSKRARGMNSNNNGSHSTNVASCLVDGCNSDLGKCRDYHRRHKGSSVVQVHAVQVHVGNELGQQRIQEFDEGKRSCRKRLDGHNRRRRKPQAEGLVRSGSFLSNYQGTQMLPFSSSHAYPSTAMVTPTTLWNAEARSHHNQEVHHNLVDHKNDLFLGSSSTSNFKEGSKQQLAFLQGHHHNSTTIPQPPPPPPPPVSVSLGTIALSSSPLLDHDHDSRCALSLLSSPNTTRTSGNVLNPHQHNHHHHHRHHQMSSLMDQPLGLSLHDRNLEPMDPVLVPTSGSYHCPPMYNNTNEAPHHPFPFHWEQ
ncbi:squamosa promoter-binding-like protein 13A [Senna tora]|uniref:Squamosa promoter-binding-like protein 13A n=1 Tax=Senna tora TaxID=362788 RepID=A0A834X6Q7_9FABA|nr:squamosa promoter-binding-like protein 13A [Senna tora]